jgi:hypothetical protein
VLEDTDLEINRVESMKVKETFLNQKVLRFGLPVTF